MRIIEIHIIINEKCDEKTGGRTNVIHHTRLLP